MIEWIKFDKDNPPQKGKYLVYQTGGIIEGYYDFHDALGFTWWDDTDIIIWGVTHYAHISYPTE